MHSWTQAEATIALNNTYGPQYFKGMLYDMLHAIVAVGRVAIVLSRSKY